MIKKTKKTVTTVTETIEHELGRGIIAVETVQNGKLLYQTFKTKDLAKTHPWSYENHRLHFSYYPNAMDSEISIDYRESKLKPEIVKNLETFNDFDNLLADWRGMDGNVYQITSPFAVPIWQQLSYIGGYTNENYDLDKVKAKLEALPFVRNVKRIDIPWYNVTEKSYKAVECEYKLPLNLLKKLKNQYFKPASWYEKKLTFDDIFGTKKPKV